MEEELKTMVPTDVGTIENYTETEGKVRFTLALLRPIEAMAKATKRAIEAFVKERTGVEPVITVREPAPAKKPQVVRQGGMEHVSRVVAIASGKGGVGKSSVAAALARALAADGLRVGLLDADIYGPSVPRLFGLEGYQPLACSHNADMMEPAISAEGIRVMSIGFFIPAGDALVWRGPMATSALKQMIHQTAWGEIDVMVVDLPPGTGDVHLTAVAELKIEGVVIVSTPSDLALADVVRGIGMFKSKNIEVPIIGVVNNMAYFAPSDNPSKRYYIFGTDEHLIALCQREHLPVLCEIPISEHYGEPLVVPPAVASFIIRSGSVAPATPCSSL